MVISAAVKGFLDQLPIEKISQYEQLLLQQMDPNLLNTLKQLQQPLAPPVEQQMANFCQRIAQSLLALSFVTSGLLAASSGSEGVKE